jgi:hypothetical protein
MEPSELVSPYARPTISELVAAIQEEQQTTIRLLEEILTLLRARRGPEERSLSC